jgi:hypothetical protein
MSCLWRYLSITSLVSYLVYDSHVVIKGSPQSCVQHRYHSIWIQWRHFSGLGPTADLAFGKRFIKSLPKKESPLLQRRLICAWGFIVGALEASLMESTATNVIPSISHQHHLFSTNKKIIFMICWCPLTLFSIVLPQRT